MCRIKVDEAENAITRTSSSSRRGLFFILMKFLKPEMMLS